MAAERGRKRGLAAGLDDVLTEAGGKGIVAVDGDGMGEILEAGPVVTILAEGRRGPIEGLAGLGEGLRLRMAGGLRVPTLGLAKERREGVCCWGTGARTEISAGVVADSVSTCAASARTLGTDCSIDSVVRHRGVRCGLAGWWGCC